MASGQNTERTLNASVADQTGFAADTILTGSSIAIPSGRLPVAGKAWYRLKFDMTKTAAGTAAPALTIRFGTAGTTADTARLSFAWAVGTAAADSGIFDVDVVFRTAGSTATAAGWARCTHHLAATGLTTTGASGTGIIFATATSFDATVANSIISASFNGGTSFAGTNTLVQAQYDNY